MKFIKEILIISMIMFSLAKIKRRGGSKLHTKSNLEWQDTYNTYHYIAGSDNYSTGEWSNVDINAPANNRKMGWFFKFSDRKSNTDALVVYYDSVYYYPYYLMNEDANWTNPAGSGKYIEFTMKKDKSNSVSVRVVFEYHLLWSEINEGELGVVKSAINSFSNNKKTQITRYRNLCDTNAATYVNSLASKTAAEGGSTTTQTQIDKYTASNTQLQTEIDAQNLIVTARTSDITKKNQEISKLQDEQTKLNTSMTQNANLSTQLTDTNTSLQAQKTAGTTDSTSYKTAMDAAQENVKTVDATLKVEVDEASTFVDTAETALLTNQSLNDYTAAFASFLP